MYKYAEMIENALDAIYHVQFQIDLLGDKDVEAQWEDLLIPRDAAQVAADLGEMPEEMIVDELFVLYHRILHNNVIGWKLDHLVFMAGMQKVYDQLKAAVEKEDFE